jgi:hypothetical protein
VWLRRQSTCPVCRLSLQDSFGTKHVRPPVFSITQSFDDSEVSLEHSHLWLLPGLERSIENISNQGNVEPVLVNTPEPTLSGEAERRQ